MEITALLKNKIVRFILFIITMPIWLYILNFILCFIIHAGRIVGTYIRFIVSGINLF